MKKIIVAILIITILLIFGYNNKSNMDQLTSQVIELKKENENLKSKVNQIDVLNLQIDDLTDKNDRLDNKADETILKLSKYIQENNEESVYKVLYYMSKLSDEDFTLEYGHKEEPYTWYVAAEALGEIGKLSIPYLVENLKSNSKFEKGVTLYALLLASQADDVDVFTSGEYIHAGLTFDEETQQNFQELALKWWEKYKDNFE